MKRTARAVMFCMAVVMVGCNEDGSGSLAPKVPQPAKPPAVRTVSPPKPLAPFKLKPVQAPSQPQLLDAHSGRGPKPVEPHTQRVAPYTAPPAGTPRPRITDPQQAAGAYLLEQK